jgi:hypothetical protein
MMDSLFAINGVGLSIVMTAMGNHFTHEAIRERRAAVYENILPENKSRVTVDKNTHFAGAMILKQEEELG